MTDAQRPPLLERLRAARSFILIGISVIFLWSVIAPPPSGPQKNHPARPLELPLAGEQSSVRLGARGSPMLVEALASWCGACRAATPTLVKASQQNPDVRFVAVLIDGDERLAQQLKRSWDIPYEIAVDQGAFKAQYRIASLPTLIFIDAAGVVRDVTVGAPSLTALNRRLTALTQPDG